MKTLFLFITGMTLGRAFLLAKPVPQNALAESFVRLATTTTSETNGFAEVSDLTRQSFLHQISIGGGLVATATLFWNHQPAVARGRATLERSYERYAPRIRAGGTFYNTDLKQLVGKNDWEGVKNALQEPPERRKEDLQKSDAGVAARARQAGGFSDACVLVAADLFAGAFSDNSITSKTKTMQAKVEKLREVVQEMQKTARVALGEEKVGGGLFGLSAKKPSDAELAKTMRALYVAGGNIWNEYVYAANDDLALQFDRFDFVR
jgi:hypothetical protein